MNTLSMKTVALPLEMEKFVKAVNRELIGVERHINRYFQDSPLNSSNYPPYNIEKFGDNEYCITIAIAGFAKENIEITIDDCLLIIDGQATVKDVTDVNFLYRGIANRDFKLRFSLADYVEVKEAKFENGLLCLNLERIIPDEKKPKTIEIK